MIGVVVRIDTANRVSRGLPRMPGVARQLRAARLRCHPTLTSVSPEMGRTSSYGVRPFTSASASVDDGGSRLRRGAVN